MTMEMVMELGFKKSRVLVLVALVCLTALCLGCCDAVDVYGSGYQGGGNDTSGYSASCKTFVNGLTELCGKPSGSGGGGASWHMYKVSDLKYYEDDHSNGLNQTPYLNYQILDNVVTIETIKSSNRCGNYDYVAIYGWEGSKLKNRYNILTGPANRSKGSGDIFYAPYNSYDAMSLKSLQSAVDSGSNIPHNKRITYDAANWLYERGGFGGKTVPANIGYFCVESGTRFQGKARAIEGTRIGDAGLNSTTGWWGTAGSTKKTTKDPLVIDCTNKSGSDCKASFIFDLRRMQKNDLRTSYTIYRKVGNGSWSKAPDNIGNGYDYRSSRKASDNYTLRNSSDTNNDKIVYRNTETMEPNGETVCYKMEFDANSKSGTQKSAVEACVRAIKKETQGTFRGRARVFDYVRDDSGWHIVEDSLKTTGFTGVDAESELFVKECPMEGCRVTFSLDVVRDSNDPIATSFAVSRFVNGKKVSAEYSGMQLKNETWYNGYIDAGGDARGTLIPRYRTGDGSASVYWASEDMKPGDEVCYVLNFNTKTGNNSPKAEVKGCAVAIGSAETMIDVKVNNDTLKTGYVDDDVYAKPEDILIYQTTYSPFTQGASSTKPGMIRIDGGNVIANSNNSEMSTLFNNSKGESLPNWNNGFLIRRENFFGLLDTQKEEIHKETIGDTSEKVVTDSEYRVNVFNVGRRLNVIGEINPDYENSGDVGADVWTVPTRVEIGFDSEANKAVGNISTSPRLDKATAIVPYNFENEICILKQKSSDCIDDDNVDTVYAGEEKSIGYRVSVNPKVNYLTTSDPENEMYATIVLGAKVRAIAYTPGEGASVDLGANEWDGEEEEFCSKYAGFSGSTNCEIVGRQDDAKFNESGKTEGSKEGKKSIEVDVPDVDAGSRICVAMAVWPANSGDDSSINTNGSETWQISRSKCFTIAKKPSFQVWGGEIYSAGGINTSLAKKTALAGYSLGIKESGAKESRTFGSWGELAVVSNGKISGLASGAGLGYAGRDGNTLWPNPTFAGGTSNKTSDYQGGGNNDNINDRDSGGGVDINSFCSVSTLTFPNGGCNSSSSSGGSGSGSGSFDFSMDDFISKNAETVQLVKLTGDSIGGIANFQSWDDDGDGNPDGKHTTVVYQSDSDDIEIIGDITYSDARYEKLQDVPKIIIYAKKNININCGVSRIDAILIAEDGNINTCSDSGDDNLKDRSNQLVVNGVTASQTLTLKRTYGAATGANSIIPAEIVNYDSSLYLWGKSQSSSDETIGTGRIKAAYIQELSPRY